MVQIKDVRHHVRQGRLVSRAGGKSMNEKAYKAMNFAGISGIVVGIIVAVVGVTAGVITIVGGARLLKEKRGLTF